MNNFAAFRPISLLFAGLLGGILGESLLFFHTHAREAESLLSADMRIVVFLKASVDEKRATVVGEEINAVPGTRSAVFVSPEDALARIEARDPTVFRSVAVMGENPLAGSFEVRLREGGFGALPTWLEAVRELAEVDEVVFKPLQVRALMQIRFYERFAGAVAALAAACAFLWLAWCIVGFLRSRTRLDFAQKREIAVACGVVMGGAAVGIAAAALLAGPASQGWIGGTVPWMSRILLLLTAGAAGLAFVLPVPRAFRGNPFAGRERRKIGAVLAAASLLLPSASVSAATVRAKQKELKQVTEQLELQKKAVDKMLRQRDEAQRALRRIAGERSRAESSVKKLKGTFKEVDGERLRLDKRLESISAAHEEGKRLLGGEVESYRRVSQKDDSFYESGSIWEGALRRRAIREKALYLAQLRVLDADSFGARSAAALRVNSIQKKAAAEMRRLESADTRLKRTRKTAASVAESAAAAETRLKELESSARELASLIQELSRRSEAKGKPHSTDAWIAKASLSWPVLGQIVERFGKHRVPELDTWTIRNGIEIAASKGAEIRPVEAGNVIFSGPFRSYGNVIIINHGKGFYSIYGRLDGLRKKKGDRVKAETVLASVGSGGGRLYLEFRQGGQAFDPAPYLKSGSLGKR